MSVLLFVLSGKGIGPVEEVGVLAEEVVVVEGGEKAIRPEVDNEMFKPPSELTPEPITGEKDEEVGKAGEPVAGEKEEGNGQPGHSAIESGATGGKPEPSAIPVEPPAGTEDGSPPESRGPPSDEEVVSPVAPLSGVELSDQPVTTATPYPSPPPGTRPCPECGKLVTEEESSCPGCGSRRGGGVPRS